MKTILKIQGRNNNDNDTQNQYVVCKYQKSRVKTFLKYKILILILKIV